MQKSMPGVPTRISETLSPVLESEAGARVDAFVCTIRSLFRRSQIALRSARLFINGVESKASARVKVGDIVSVEFAPPPEFTATPENIPLTIRYEDDDMLVIDKAQGMVVHPAAGNHTGTLVHALLYHFTSMRASFPRDDRRPGIVHRLDKDTSGLIVVAKHPEALAALSDQFAARKVHKQYLALVRGVPRSSSGRIDARLGRDPSHRKRFAVTKNGKEALTQFRLLKRFNGYSLMLLSPRTGRTHQLRVHMKHIGHPILGDELYNPRDNSAADSLMLHAYRIGFSRPGILGSNYRDGEACDNAGRIEIVSRVPERFRIMMGTAPVQHSESPHG